MKHKWLPIAMAVAVVLGTTALLWAEGAAGPAPEAAKEAVGAPAKARGLMRQLTPEQREELNAKLKEMKEAGATPEQIREAVHGLLQGWGVQPPVAREPREGKGGGGIFAQLTPEQRQEVKAKLQELRAAGKTPQEIHAALQELFKGWGIEPPAVPPRAKPTAAAEPNV